MTSEPTSFLHNLNDRRVCPLIFLASFSSFYSIVERTTIPAPKNKPTIQSNQQTTQLAMLWHGTCTRKEQSNETNNVKYTDKTEKDR